MPQEAVRIVPPRPAEPERSASVRATPKPEEMIASLIEKKDRILSEIEKVILGQRDVLDLLLVGVFSKGHSLFVGVPGLAKTLMVNALAEVMDLKFQRIQFTPDLMPSDITGTEVLEEDVSTGRRVFRFIRGPIFTNILLADEINRTPPKTQAALLQAMQEYKVTVGGETYTLDQPFIVFATQNPIEQEGTYPLPEAQLDRFMLHVDVRYPEAEREIDVVKATTGESVPQPRQVISHREILECQEWVRQVAVPDHTVEYAVRLVGHTRPVPRHATIHGRGQTEHGPFPSGSRPAPRHATVAGVSRADGSGGLRRLPYVEDWVSWGASPRASQNLIIGAKARALLSGRPYAAIEDVRALAMPVLKHRIILNFKAEAEGVRSETIIEKLLEDVKD